MHIGLRYRLCRCRRLASIGIERDRQSWRPDGGFQDNFSILSLVYIPRMCYTWTQNPSLHFRDWYGLKRTRCFAFLVRSDTDLREHYLATKGIKCAFPWVLAASYKS